MRIDELRLRNFRCFEEFRIAFHPSMTVLVGVNGAGKSAILSALAASLNVPPFSIQDQVLEKSDHRFVTVQAGNLLTVERAGELEIEISGWSLGSQLHWKTLQNSIEGLDRFSRDVRGVLASKGSSPDVQAPLPVVKFFGTSRLWASGDVTTGLGTPGSRALGYARSLRPDADEKLLRSWIAHLEQIRLQKIAEDLEAGRTPTLPELPELEAVNRAVTTCIEGAKRIFFSVKHGELRVEMQDGTLLPFSLLSDGYRNFLGMVADIAWRCVQLNPHLGGEAPLKTEGVVLIDEVDLHLHPGWQRRVLHDLLAAFPRVQFVVTTHSPQVLSTAKREWVRILVPGEAEARDASHVEGRDSNAILEDIFGVPARPQGAVAEVEALFQEIDQERYPQARALLQGLEARMGPDDPDLVRARWMIEREDG